MQKQLTATSVTAMPARNDFMIFYIERFRLYTPELNFFHPDPDGLKCLPVSGSVGRFSLP
jgi:hypothetical protein